MARVAIDEVNTVATKIALVGIGSVGVPANAKICGFTIKMYAMLKKITTPPRDSFVSVVSRSTMEVWKSDQIEFSHVRDAAFIISPVQIYRSGLLLRFRR
jgi:hypothetical protein